MAEKPKSDPTPDPAGKPDSTPDSAAELDLEPDFLVSKIKPDPSQPPVPVIERRGFLGKSDRSKYRRLYATPASTEYLEIADDDIVHRERDKDPNAGSRIWIKATAMLRWGPPKEVQAADLPAQTPENPVACRSSSCEQSTTPAVVNPAILFFAAPFISWVLAAQFCSTAASMLGSGMAGAARIARGCVAPADRSLCGRDKIILLSPSEYKVILS